jgi:hypothetical protein
MAKDYSVTPILRPGTHTYVATFRRADAIRRRLGRFLNFVASKYEFPSSMLRVPSVGRNDILRERGDIQWHPVEAVEALRQVLAEESAPIGNGRPYANPRCRHDSKRVRQPMP